MSTNDGPVASSSQPAAPLGTTSRPPDHELETINKSLTARRQRSSFSHLIHPHQKDAPSSSHRQRSDLAEGTAGDPGEVFDDVEEDEDTSQMLRDFEIRDSEVMQSIHVLKGGREVDLEDEGEDGEYEQEYVWDVLFENQRGIHFLGKANFSSRTLLPSDPSPFTVPSNPIPSASSFAISHPSTSSSTSNPSNPTGQTKRKKSKKPPQPPPNDHGRSIKTLYTIDTYQPPSPAWEYITPWMINMRQGTDEVGWRYNAWFKNRGWSSHAGNLGWWGWVRRREWVRLRCLKPKSVDVDGPDVRTEETDEKTGIELGEVLEGDEIEWNLTRIIKALGPISLDRHKLEVWDLWLDTKDEKDIERLQAVLEDDSAVLTLQRQFTYQTSFPRLVEMLQTKGWKIAQIPTPPGSPRPS